MKATGRRNAETLTYLGKVETADFKRFQRTIDLLNACGKGYPCLAAALNNLDGTYQFDGDSVNLNPYRMKNHLHRESTLTNIA